MPIVEISWCCCFLSVPCGSSNRKRKEKESPTPSHDKRTGSPSSSTGRHENKRKGKKSWFRFPHSRTKKDGKKRTKEENPVASSPAHADKKDQKRRKDDDKKGKGKGKEEKSTLSPSSQTKKEDNEKRKKKEEEPEKVEKMKEKEEKPTKEDKKKGREEKPTKEGKLGRKEEGPKKEDNKKGKEETTNNDQTIKYDVFISFRGTDVRQTFVSHLFAHMNNERHLLTFKDDVSLRRGDEVSPSLTEAIERSSSYVVIFSPNYATSDWCLNELVKIMECARRYGRKMIPVFYGGVTPSHVRHQKQRYADAFVQHKKEHPDDKEMEAKIKSWRSALTEAANISGFESTVVKPERRLVEEVAKSILGVIRPESSPVTQGLVGIEPEIEAVEKLLETDDTKNNRVIGFWGMPGIGKTTLAKAIFEQIDPDKFKGRHYIQNFAGQLKRTTTVIDLQNELFDKLLGDENSHDIPFNLKRNRLRRLRAFVIIDDVTSLQTLQELTEGKFISNGQITLRQRFDTRQGA
ncbi:unnamed protein product [Linum trigynum]|uniref:TIR domain-containing protein n=1 Tax=Linum trigynum TaxID=586398 RepID=A0AAV2D1N3_9ROSI